MDSNGFLWVLIDFYSSLQILMGPYKFLFVFMDSFGTLWVFIHPLMHFN